MIRNTKKRGFLVLTMVLLVCATVLIVVTGILLRSITQVNETADSEKSLTAWSTVNACGEYALLQMIASTTSTSTTADNWNYGGGQTEMIGDNQNPCYIYPVSTESNGFKLVKASSVISSFTKKILIEVATNTPSLVINSWKEVADFQ